MKHVILDLGNVVVFFDHRRASRQLAALSPLAMTEEEVFRSVFDTALEPDLDCGRIPPREFLDRLRSLLQITAPDEAIVEAWCDIFRPNDHMTKLLPRLKRSASTLLLASNTNALHFQWLQRQMPEPLALFDGWVLSYEVGLRKPDRDFFEHCAATAGAAPGDCVFVDDRPDFVEGARATGMAGVTYRSGLDIEGALRAEGLQLR